jgi:hypothetical protein
MRFDFVFSYWIFAWYLLYMAKIVIYRPKLVILLGIIENTILLISMILYGSNLRTISSFIIINTFIKLIPYYSLRHETIRTSDWKPTVIIFLLYCFWIYLNKQDLTGNYKNVFDSLIKNRYDTPAMELLQKVSFVNLNVVMK